MTPAVFAALGLVAVVSVVVAGFTRGLVRGLWGTVAVLAAAGTAAFAASGGFLPDAGRAWVLSADGARAAGAAVLAVWVVVFATAGFATTSARRWAVRAAAPPLAAGAAYLMAPGLPVAVAVNATGLTAAAGVVSAGCAVEAAVRRRRRITPVTTVVVERVAAPRVVVPEPVAVPVAVAADPAASPLAEELDPEPEPEPEFLPEAAPLESEAVAPAPAPAPVPAPGPPPAPLPTPEVDMTWTPTRLTIPAGRKFAGREILVFRRPPDKQIRVPARIADRFVVENVLATGGMGAVLRVRDEKLAGRPVLVKIALLDHAKLFPGRDRVSPDIADAVRQGRERLEDEARNLLELYGDLDARIPTVSHLVRDYSAQLHGPHGADPGWYWEADTKVDVDDLIGQEPYLVMRHIDGANLKDLLAARDPVIPAFNTLGRARAALALGRQLASLLAHFHRRRDFADAPDPTDRRYFVHQDLKPDNLIRTRVGDYFLIDFGTVKDVIVVGNEHRFDHAAAEGTKGYLAPETGELNARVSELSDLYSFGATLFHYVTGEPPPARGDLAAQAVHARGLHDPALFGKLFDIIDACTRPDPADRRAAVYKLPCDKKDLIPADLVRSTIIRAALEI